MHARSLVRSAALLALCATPLAAQNTQCTPYAGSSQTFNVCNAAIDGTRAFHPLAGLLISGGSPVLGDHGNLGGIGHLSITARVNATRVTLPSTAYDGSTATVPPGDSLLAPAPVVEAAVGLFKGSTKGLFGIDLLASATLLPTTVVDNLTIDPDARRIGSVALGLGYGVRVSLFDDKGSLPGISVSAMQRDLPRLTYGIVGIGTADDFQYDVKVKATNFRLDIGKTFSVVSLGVGLGQDRYRGDANIVFRNPLTTLPEAPIALDLAANRTMAFANLGLNLGPVKLVGEGGYQLGKDQQLTTNFQGFDTTAGRFFFSGGLRVGI
jgi:hypothetical protein